MSYIFNGHNSEYGILLNQRAISAEQFGIPHLNGEQFRELLERIHLLEEGILQTLSNEKLSQTYNGWQSFFYNRRCEIIKNIYRYNNENKFERALLLIGAEHRKPIMDMSPEFEKSNNCDLNWNFNYFN